MPFFLDLIFFCRSAEMKPGLERLFHSMKLGAHGSNFWMSDQKENHAVYVWLKRK